MRSHPIGKHGRRTPWGGQIGGVEPCIEDKFLKQTSLTNETSANDAAKRLTLSPRNLRPFSAANSSTNNPTAAGLLANAKNDVHLPKITKTLQV
jgi:hypothetical protein